MKRLALACNLIFVITLPVAANELAKGYTCAAGQKPELLMRKLMETNNIDQKWFENVDGVPSHAAKPGLTAFGLPLIAVSAWQANSKLFSRAPGTAPTAHYAFVVQATMWELRQAAQRHGVKVATAKEIGTFPYVEVRSFNTEYPESLPPGIGNKLAFAQITCHIGL